MKFHVPPCVSGIASAAALCAALVGCTISGDKPGPAAGPPEVKKPEAKKPEAKKPEAKKPEPPRVPPADLSPREAASEWWQAVLNEDRKRADLYVINSDTNDFLIQYVHELKKNADAESRKELESMRRAVFGRVEKAENFIIVPMTKDGEHFVKVFFQKHNGRWLIFTIN